MQAVFALITGVEPVYSYLMGQLSVARYKGFRAFAVINGASGREMTGV